MTVPTSTPPTAPRAKPMAVPSSVSPTPDHKCPVSSDGPRVVKVLDAGGTATGSKTLVTVRICQIATAITIPASAAAHFLTSNAAWFIPLPRVLPSGSEQEFLGRLAGCCPGHLVLRESRAGQAVVLRHEVRVLDER